MPSSVTARPRTVHELPHRRLDEPGRVVGAVAAAGPVDEDDVVAADLLGPAGAARLVGERAQPGAPLLLHVRRHRVLGGRLRARPRRVREDVHLGQPRRPHRLERALEREVVLGGKADDHVGGEVEVRQRLELPQVGLDRVAARHRLQHAVVARLERHVQVRPDDRRLAQRGDELVVDVVDLDRGEPQPLDAVDRTGGADQPRERKPGRAVAEAAEVDAGEDDLAVTLARRACGSR